MGEQGKISVRKVSGGSVGSPRKSRGLIAGVVVVLFGVAMMFFFWPEEAAVIEPEEKPVEKPKVVTPISVAEEPTERELTRDEILAKQREARRAAAEAKKAELEKKKSEYVKKPGQMMLPDGTILTFPAPKEGETRLLHAYGHTYECDHLGNFKNITPRKLFHTAFEGNFLALAQADKPFIPAFLTGLEESDVRKMLEKPYQPIGDETDDEKEQLKAYDDLRAAVLEYMDQGGKFDDFVQDVAKMERKQREARARGLRDVMTLVKQGRVEEAKVMNDAANQYLSEKGFKPIKLPAHVQAAFDQLN